MKVMKEEMTLIEILYNGKVYVCENTLEEIESQMNRKDGFLHINECYWKCEGLKVMKSKRRPKMLIKSNVQEITVIKNTKK
jgi:hypothetical protein